MTCATFPFAIFLCRIFKNILLATPGEALGFAPIFYSSLLIFLPVTFPYGALFTYGCKLYDLHVKENATSIGKVYIIETVGSMIGGLLGYLFAEIVAWAIGVIPFWSAVMNDKTQQADIHMLVSLAAFSTAGITLTLAPLPAIFPLTDIKLIVFQNLDI
jgi:uncharacterized membrane protein YjgN (DUF898 family)